MKKKEDKNTIEGDRSNLRLKFPEKYDIIFTPDELAVLRNYTPNRAAEILKNIKKSGMLPIENIDTDFTRTSKTCVDLTRSGRGYKEGKFFPECPISIPIGGKNFEDLLGGGFSGGNLYDLYGDFASGKTQICMNLAAIYAVLLFVNEHIRGIIKRYLRKDVLAELPLDFDIHPPEKRNVIYIDTGKDFRPERVAEIILNMDKKILGNMLIKIYKNYTEKSFTDKIKEFINNLDIKSSLIPIMRKIKISRPQTPDNLLLILENILYTTAERPALLILDTFGKTLTKDPHLGDYGTILLKKRAEKILGLLKKISVDINIPVVITSECRSRDEEFIPNTKPYLQLHLHRYCDHIIYLYRNERGDHTAHLVYSVLLPEKRCGFKIGNGGIYDA